MPTSKEAERLNIIFEEFMNGKRYGSGIGPFAKAIGSSKSTLHGMINGERPLSKSVIDGICKKLGYSPEWVINGTGRRKAALKDKSTLTEVSLLRTQIEVLRQEVARLAARMKAYEEK